MGEEKPSSFKVSEFMFKVCGTSVVLLLLFGGLTCAMGDRGESNEILAVFGVAALASLAAGIIAAIWES